MSACRLFHSVRVAENSDRAPAKKVRSSIYPLLNSLYCTLYVVPDSIAAWLASCSPPMADTSINIPKSTEKIFTKCSRIQKAELAPVPSTDKKASTWVLVLPLA